MSEFIPDHNARGRDDRLQSLGNLGMVCAIGPGAGTVLPALYLSVGAHHIEASPTSLVGAGLLIGGLAVKGMATYVKNR